MATHSFVLVAVWHSVVVLNGMISLWTVGLLWPERPWTPLSVALAGVGVPGAQCQAAGLHLQMRRV